MSITSHNQSDERLQVTLLFSVIMHAIVILGVTFTSEDPAARIPALDVVLVTTQTKDKPKQADFLANATRAGGGEHDFAQRPRENLSGGLPKDAEGIAPIQTRQSIPNPNLRPTPVISGSSAEFSVNTDTPTPDTDQKPLPTARDLMERSLEMAKLAAEIDRRKEEYAKRPKRKFISASTREYAYAAYMRAWVARVERIGNVNFPAEARERRLDGELVLTVAVKRDGSVESIEIIQSSGHALLDDAATQIVRHSEPFGQLPRTQESIDVLHITRTWQFLADGSIETF